MTYIDFLDMLDELKNDHPGLKTVAVSVKSYKAFADMTRSALAQAGLGCAIHELVDPSITNINGIDVIPDKQIPVGVACLFGPGREEIGVVDRREHD